MWKYLKFILFVLFQIMRYVIDLIVKLLYCSARICNNRSLCADLHKNGACVQKIIFRYRIQYIFPGQGDFIAVPLKFEDSRIILQDNVSIYSLSEKEARFVLVPPHINVYSSDISSFIGIGQFKWANYLITMPFDVLHKVARELGKPKVPLVMIYHTARAGSTILTQAFETVPGIRCIAELPALVPGLLLEMNFSRSSYERLIVDIICILCKPVEGITMYCIKTTSTCLPLAPIIARNFPDAKQLFVSRDGYKSVDSYHRAFQDFHEVELSMTFKSNFLLRQLFPSVAYVLRYLSIPDTGSFPWLKDDKYYAKLEWFEIAALNWSLLIAYYKHLQDTGIHVPCILYEDIVGHPKLTMDKIFKFCGVSDKYIPQALAAFSRDSQRDCSFAWTVSRKKQGIPMDVLKKVADQFNIKLGIPLFGESLKLPNVL